MNGSIFEINDCDSLKDICDVLVEALVINDILNEED